MEHLYLVIVVILFALALSDLIVGVSNDAVNFLNSAFGSKAARKWVIFSCAALGILIGATFSNGMMEIARKGVFHPDMFSFSEIMLIFLAVMITDVVLLDFFNTFGLPTSTTVSLVFELLGSAVAVSLIKISKLGGSVADLGKYVNSDKALAIITGILVSIVIAFIFGILIQYLVRLIFTFNYKKVLHYGGSFFGGVSITLISYFILIKGIEGSYFAGIPVGSEQVPLSRWISENSGLLILVSLLGWTALFQLMWWIFRTDVLKVVVLAGTFALAMAFAGNDLVNFIGAPVAGFNSFQAWHAAGGTSPGSFKMDMLLGDVKTPFLFLLIAGGVMIITLITSKKAKAVIETGVSLGRQAEGAERFGSSAISRAIVRSSVRLNNKVKNLLPGNVNRFIMNRFTPVAMMDDQAGPAFDKLRAAVNLIVASSLIAFGTSLKLPLSTTYVTFMVAMGSSLADRAWGRDSAVYRVSGVFAVIAGWFLTAIIAFAVSSLVAWVISSGGMPAIIGLIVITIFLVVRTHIIFKRRTEKTTDDEDLINENDEAIKRIEKCTNQVVKSITGSGKIFTQALDAFLNENIYGLREAMEIYDRFEARTKKQKNKIIQTITEMQKVDLDAGYFYIQVIDYQREMAHSLHFLVDPLKEHLENQHKPFTEIQSSEIRSLIGQTALFFDIALSIIREGRFDSIEDLVLSRVKIFETIYAIEKSQIGRIREKEVSTRNSLLFFKALAETKNLLLQAVNLIKSHRDFILANRKMPV